MPSYFLFAALALVILVNAAPPALAAPAERIFRGGPIVTVDPARPAAEAVAIGGGTILAVGAEADVMKLAGPETVVTELAGRTLVPGFVDGHSHFFSVVSVQTSALCASPPAGPCTSVADVIERLKELQKRRTIPAGELIEGFGYDPDLLAEKRAPTKQELDAAFPDNPVMIVHVSGHGAMLNSKALAKFGITAATPTPPGGVIGREPGSEEPSGLLFETAFLPIFAQVSGPGADETLELIRTGQELYARQGITTAQEGATMKQQLDMLRLAAARGPYDLILCNPPYVNRASMQTLPPEYRAEPALALDGGLDGMDFVRPLLAQAAAHLRPGGVLVLEIGHERAHFEAAFPTLSPLWLSTSVGDDQVLLLTREDLAS